MKKVSLKFISLVLIFSFILGSSNLAYCVDSTSSKATVVNAVGDGLRYYVVFEYRGTQYRSDEMGASFNNRMWGMLGEEDRKKVSSNYAFAPHYRMDQFGQAGSEAITSWSNDVSGWTAAGEAWRAAIGAREFPVLTEFYSSTGYSSMMVGSEHLDDVNMELRNLSAEAKMHSQYQTAFNLAQDISLEYEAGRVIFEKLVQLKADQIGNAFKAGSEVLIKDIIIDNILIPSITPSAAKASTIIADCIGFIKDRVLNIYDALQDDPTPGEILAAMQAIIDKLENTAEGIKTDIESKLVSLASLMETLREYEQEKNAEKSNLNLQETTALLSSGETTFAGSSESADYNHYSAHTEDTPEEYEIKRQAVIAEAEDIKSSYESLINYILEEKSRIYLLLNFDDDGVLNRHPSMTEKYYNNLWVFDEVSAPDGPLGITGRIPPEVNLFLSAGTKEAILSDIPDIVSKWETSISKLEGYISEVNTLIGDEQIKTEFEEIEKRINGLYNLYWQYNGGASLTNYIYQNWAPEALRQHLQYMITNEGGDGYYGFYDSSDYHILTYIEDLKSSIEKTLSYYKDEYPAFESEIRNAAAGYDSLYTNLQNSATYMAGAYNSRQSLYRDSPYIYFYNQENQGEDVPKVDELAINIEIAGAPDDQKEATINAIIDDLKELREQELQYMTRIYNGRNNTTYDANKLDQLLSELQVRGNLTAYANLGVMIGKEITDSATYLDEDNTISRLYRGLTILNMSNIPEVLASLEGTSDAFYNARLISDEIEDKETEFLSMSDDDFDEAFDDYKNQLDSAMVTSTFLNTTQLENAWDEYYRGYNKLEDLRSRRTGEYLVTSIQPVFYGTLTSALNITMDIDEQVRVEALLTPVNATNQYVTWTSSNTDVATVDENGWITALSEGMAMITIASADGNATEDCFVMVRSGGSNIQLSISGLTAENKSYDGTLSAALSGEPALVGVQEGDDVSLNGTPTAVFNNKDAGTGKTVTVSGFSLSGADANKYILVQPTLTANITKKALTATADNKTRLVGRDNPAATISYSGFIPGEDENNSGITAPSASTAAVSNSPAGSYPITLSGGSGGQNYELTLVNGTLTVESQYGVIVPDAVSFDKKTSAQADIVITMTLNDNVFTALKKGDDTIAPENYTIDGNTLTIKKAYLATLPKGDTALTFVFTDASNVQNTKTLTVTVSDSTTFVITTSTVPGVTVASQDGSQSPVPIGQSYAFTVTLPEKYDPLTLVVKAGNDILTAENGVYTVANIQANTLISVSANIKTFALTTSSSLGGTISPPTKTVSYGENATITLLPSTGYEVDTFTVAGADKKAQLVGGTYTLKNITSDIAVAVAYKAKQVAVFKIAGAGGTITANNTVSYGADLAVTITPNAGSFISSVSYTVGGIGVPKTPTLTAGEGSSKTFTVPNVTNSVYINALFAPVDKYALLHAVMEAENIDTEPYEEIYKTAFKTALMNALNVAKNPSATADEVAAATAALTNAKNELTDAHIKTFVVHIAPTENGSVWVSNTNPKYGESISINVSPASGYELYKVYVNGAQYNGMAVRDIRSTVSIVARFKLAKPDEVNTFISSYSPILNMKISTLNPNEIEEDLQDVYNALTAYSALSAESQRYLATTYQQLVQLQRHLLNLRKASVVSVMIRSLENDNSMAFVRDTKLAKVAYDSLTPDQKKLLPLSEVSALNLHLIAANVIYLNNVASQAKIDYVNGLIDDLHTTIGAGAYTDVTAASEAYFNAKNNYDSLTAEQKRHITNAAKLTTLKSAIDSANEAAANDAADLINALTAVETDTPFADAEVYKKAIIEAKNAYDALTAVQKALIPTATKTKLDQCFESVSIVIEKPMPENVDQNLAGGVSFTGISDTIADLGVGTPDDYAGTEATINVAINSGGSDNALKTELILNLTPKDAGGAPVQPEGKVKIRILLGDALAAKSDTLSIVYTHGGQVYSVPCTIIIENGKTYLEFETDRFSTYAVVSLILSSNNYLSVLSASDVSLSPAFIKTTLGYTGTVSNSVTSTTISADPEDPAASIAGTGAKTLHVGANTYNIVATAQDGSIRTYTITITREGAPTDDSGSSEGPATTPAPDVTSSSADNKTTVATSVTGTTNSETASTSAALSTTTASALLDKAKAAEINGQKAIVEIKVETTAASNRAELTIPRTEFNAIAADTSADVKVETSLGTITFNAKAVDTISDAAAAGEIAVEIAKVDLSTLPQEVRSFVGDRPIFNFTVKAGGSVISEFGGGTAQISIPYTPKAGEDINSIVVWYIDDSGKLQNVRGAFNEKTGTVYFKTSHFSKYAVGYNKVKFTDVTDDAWYSGAVSFIAARSITTGTGNGMFSPDASLTRGQFLVMLMRAYGIAADSSPVNNFSDAGDTYYTGFLSAAKRLGITTGIGDNLFAPESSITRQDMFTLLYRGLEVIGELPTVTTGRSLKDFSDAVEVSEYAKNAIDALIMSGIVLGSDGKIAPNETSNRAQMAQIIYRLLS